MKRNNQNYVLSIVLKILLAFTLSSCGSITQIDVPFCIEIDISKAFCTTPISGKDQIIDDTHLLEGRTYWDIRPTMILIPPSSYAAIKSFILKQCKRNPDMCDKEIPAWDRATESVDKQILLKQP